MADKFLVDFDPFSGVAHYAMWSELDDAFHYTAVQDADAILRANAEDRANAPRRFGEMAKVASIPLPLFFELKAKGIIDDKKKLQAWLRDPDNRFFLCR